MSLLAFQHALADLVASPDRCRRLTARPEDMLRDYPLSTREQVRLTSIVRHPGMSVNCTLYRASRLEALYTLLPLTCFVLGGDLQTEVEQYWQFREHTDLQFRTEAARWGAFLTQRIRDAKLSNPYVREVLAFELAASDLSYLGRLEPESPGQRISDLADAVWRLHPMLRVVRFDHDPAVLLKTLQDRRLPPTALARDVHYVLLDRRADVLVVGTLDVELGRFLTKLSKRPMRLPRRDSEHLLINAGLVLPLPVLPA
jgi:hypothetical protein